MKYLLLLFSITSYLSEVFSQELLCNVRVNSSQIQTSDRKVFQTMQTEIYEFINNRIWTTSNFQNEERIECTFVINVSKKDF